jgi:FkbM family methyltransferase
MAGARVRILGAVAAGSRRAGARGAARRLARVSDSLFLAVGRAPLTAKIDGVSVSGYLRHRSFLAEAMRPRETYAELFVRSLRPGMTVIDGGAHTGLYTLLAARAVGLDGLVLAFEPDRYNLSALHFNVRRSGAVNIVVTPKALSTAPGTATFYETTSTIGSSLLERPDSRRHTVETTSVDAELDGRAITELLVKLNVEGAEPLVLEGMRETLARVPAATLFIEVNPPLLEAAGTDVGAFLAGLEADGFEVSYIDLPTQTPVALPEPLRKGHLYATRRAASSRAAP